MRDLGHPVMFGIVRPGPPAYLFSTNFLIKSRQRQRDMVRGKVPPTVEDCRICKRRRLLRNSHVIPRGVYRRVQRDEKFSVNIVQRKAILSQAQLKAPLFCSDCEQRLSKRGEDYFLSNCLQRDGSFPLFFRAEICSPSLKAIRPQAGYWKADTLGADYEKIVYFGASIFYRTWAAKTKLPNHQISIEFEPTAGEALRAYLNEECQDIPNVALNVSLIPPVIGSPRDFRYAYSLPQEIKTHTLGSSVRFYTSECLGFAFTLVSSDDPGMISAMQTNCLLHNPDHPIFISSEMLRATVNRQINWVRNSQPTAHLRAYNETHRN